MLNLRQLADRQICLAINSTITWFFTWWWCRILAEKEKNLRPFQMSLQNDSLTWPSSTIRVCAFFSCCGVCCRDRKKCTSNASQTRKYFLRLEENGTPCNRMQLRALYFCFSNRVLMHLPPNSPATRHNFYSTHTTFYDKTSCVESATKLYKPRQNCLLKKLGFSLSFWLNGFPWNWFCFVLWVTRRGNRRILRPFFPLLL